MGGNCCVQGVPRICIKFAFENLVERDQLQDQEQIILRGLLKKNVCVSVDRIERCHSKASWRVEVWGS